jgi:hypothetical protein
MITNAPMEDAMSSLRSPEFLCERLGMRPTTYQRELMHKFYNDVNPLQTQEIPAEHTLNAAAICALWRALMIPGSQTIVIAANRELEKRFMGFVHDITTTVDPALTSSCAWVNGRHMNIGDTAGYWLRFLPNDPKVLARVRADVVTWVILGAKSSDTKFNDARRQAESNMDFEGHRHIIIW